MSCEALQSIAKTCDNNTGGIRTVWICQQENVTTATPAWEITSLVLTDPANVYAINRNTGNYTEETAVDLISGSSFVTQTITLMFNRREAAKSEAINILASGQRYLSALVLDANEKYWYFEDLQLTATGEGSGTARADGSKYSITLLAEANFLASEITAGAVASVTP